MGGFQRKLERDGNIYLPFKDESCSESNCLEEKQYTKNTKELWKEKEKSHTAINRRNAQSDYTWIHYTVKPKLQKCLHLCSYDGK